MSVSKIQMQAKPPTKTENYCSLLLIGLNPKQCLAYVTSRFLSRDKRYIYTFVQGMFILISVMFTYSQQCLAYITSRFFYNS